MPGAQNYVDTKSGEEEATRCRDCHVCAGNGPWDKEGRDGRPQGRNESPRLTEVSQWDWVVAGPGLDLAVWSFGGMRRKEPESSTEHWVQLNSGGFLELLAGVGGRGSPAPRAREHDRSRGRGEFRLWMELRL